MIRQIRSSELHEAANVVRVSFATVAHELGLDAANCPTHPTFLSDEQVTAMISDGMCFYGLFVDRMMVGVVGEKRVNEQDYTVEKLAVLPNLRHGGFGRQLMDHACDLARRAGGQRVTIAIVDENETLKQWYLGMGFRITEIRRYDHLPFQVCCMERNI
jgi:diamine N-acetyltransferase